MCVCAFTLHNRAQFTLHMCVCLFSSLHLCVFITCVSVCVFWHVLSLYVSCRRIKWRNTCKLLSSPCQLLCHYMSACMHSRYWCCVSVFLFSFVCFLVWMGFFRRNQASQNCHYLEKHNIIYLFIYYVFFIYLFFATVSAGFQHSTDVMDRWEPQCMTSVEIKTV